MHNVMLVDVTDALQDLIDAVAEGDKTRMRDTHPSIKSELTVKVVKSGKENPGCKFYYYDGMMMFFSFLSSLAHWKPCECFFLTPSKSQRALPLFINRKHYLEVLSHLDQKLK